MPSLAVPDETDAIADGIHASLGQTVAKEQRQTFGGLDAHREPSLRTFTEPTTRASSLSSLTATQGIENSSFQQTPFVSTQECTVAKSTEKEANFDFGSTSFFDEQACPFDRTVDHFRQVVFQEQQFVEATTAPANEAHAESRDLSFLELGEKGNEQVTGGAKAPSNHSRDLSFLEFDSFEGPQDAASEDATAFTVDSTNDSIQKVATSNSCSGSTQTLDSATSSSLTHLSTAPSDALKTHAFTEKQSNTSSRPNEGTLLGSSIISEPDAEPSLHKLADTAALDDSNKKMATNVSLLFSRYGSISFAKV